MGSMWMDPRDDNVFPVDPGQTILPFDPNLMTDRRSFPKVRWGSDFQSLLVLVDFVKLGYLDKIVIQSPPRPGGARMQQELSDLVILQRDRRPAAMQEIVAQDIDFQLYICATLSISPKAYPTTYLMMKMAARIGELVMVHLKDEHNAVRPSQIYPKLFPPVPVAPHASYPSGHALVAHMMAYMISNIVPKMGDEPSLLAQRIAENREIAGLHFKSDTVGGIEAAQQAFNFFKQLDWYKQRIGVAQAEWNAV